MKIIITILFFLTSLTSLAQLSDKDSIYLILRSYNLNDPNRLVPAKIAFQHFILDNPQSNYKAVATFYLAEIADKPCNVDSAIILYDQVLNMPIPDSVDIFYRNYAAKRLAGIYIDKNDFTTAISYLDLARDKFHARHQCGYGRAEDFIEMKVLYARCYEGQVNYEKAIDSLAPYMFSNTFAPNTKLVKELYEVYLKVYTKQEIKNEFTNAYKTLVLKKEKYYDYTFLRPTIKIFNCEVGINVYDYEINKMTEAQQKQKCIDHIIHSEIYKLASEGYMPGNNIFAANILFKN